MFKHIAGARLGIFIFLGTVLIVLGIFLIGNKESLFVESITIKSYFTSVEGLRKGAPVRLSGLGVGSVSNIRLRSDSTHRVEVTMRIEESFIQFIRLDSEASIETEGLIGTKILSITPGSAREEVVSDGSVIRSKTPVSMSSVVEKTEGIIKYTEQITKEFAEIVEKVNKGQGTIGSLINDDRLFQAAVQVTESADTNFNAITKRLGEISEFVITLGQSLESIIVNIDSSVVNVKEMVRDVEKGRGVLGALIADRSAYDSMKTVINNLVITTDESVKGARAFVENMEALKHNWLFKSYFEERGYWDEIEYQKEIDAKIKHLDEQTKIIEDKIQELKELEKKMGMDNQIKQE